MLLFRCLLHVTSTPPFLGPVFFFFFFFFFVGVGAETWKEWKEPLNFRGHVLDTLLVPPKTTTKEV